MRFTIVTPVFDGMPWLPDAIHSVAASRPEVDLEHLVFDAGSTDGSREWLTAHAELGFDARFEPDAGQTDALAKGFDVATGDLFGWLNADDLLEPGTLRRAHDLFEANPDVVMIIGACLFIDASGRILGAMATPPEATFSGLLTRRINPPQPSTFFRADGYRSAGGLDRVFALAMDLDLWLRLAKQGPFMVLPDEILSRYRVHTGAKSERMAVRSAREDLRARRAQGMPWGSPAGAELLQAAYIRPATGPMKRAVARPIRALLRRALRFGRS